MIIFRGPSRSRTSLAALLGGLPVEGVILSPPPAQASIPVYSPEDIPETNLPEDLTQLAAIVDKYRDSQAPFLIVSWARSIKQLARHAVGRAASTDFPQMVADMADQIDPIDQ